MDPGLGSHLSPAARAGGCRLQGRDPRLGLQALHCPGSKTWLPGSSYLRIGHRSPADSGPDTTRSPRPAARSRCLTPPWPPSHGSRRLLGKRVHTYFSSLYSQGSPQDECHCTFSLPGLGTPLPTGRGHSTLRRPLAQSGSSLPPAACGATACPRMAYRLLLSGRPEHPVSFPRR